MIKLFTRRCPNNKVPSNEELMPGKDSEVGFLKEGQILARVIERDNRALNILGYTKSEIIKLLNPLVKTANKSINFNLPFRFKAKNGNEFLIILGRSVGKQLCPWSTDYLDKYASTDFLIYASNQNPANEKPIITIPGLMLHLVTDHNFFEGGSYRIAPETIVELFGSERIPGSIAKAKELLI